jgi:DNA-binding transcriptional regulator LsrR (DeoR family)
MADMSFTTEAARAKLWRIRELLKAKAMTAHELAEAVPMSKRWVQAYLNHLKDDERIYIQSWTHDVEQCERMYPRPIYKAVVPRKDADKPAPLTKAQRQARKHQKMMADPIKYGQHIAKERVRRAARTGRTMPAIRTTWASVGASA